MKLQPTTYNLQPQKGFTLIEAIVSASLFAFVVTSILGTYMAVLRLNTRLRAERALAQNARFITEFFGKEIRNGHIDYTHGGYGDLIDKDVDVNNFEPGLYVVNQNNELERFYLNDLLNKCPGVSKCDLMIEKNGVSAALNSSSVRVTFLQFKVRPGTDPFFRSSGTNEQPHVTVALELTANMGQRDAIKIQLQSTY